MNVNQKIVEREYRRLNRFLHGKKFILWDSINKELVTKIEPKGFEDEFGLRINQIVLYSGDSSIDNGYFDTEKEFLEKLERYKTIEVLNPEIIEILK